ncbi:Lectin, partial [Globisporangium splendens]
MWTKTLYALAVAAACALHATGVSAEALNHLTFKEPYDKVGLDGKRQLSDEFEVGGSTDVKKNFVRLTPDRQSKRGNIWSRRVIGSEKFVSVVTFRIHGQGKKWFGDGIGVWLTHEGRYMNGDNHGFTDQYYGVGIVLDTFKNVEHRGGHKDVTVQINDGKKTLDILNDETKVGCDAAFRYHSNSAAFDPVYSSSRLRIKVDGNKLTLEIDPKNEGKWTQCYKGTLPFSQDWLRRATLGITASTGALADNHDIISVRSFDDLNDYGMAQADADVWTHNYSKEFQSLMDNPVCDQSCKISILQKVMSNFHVETEHWFEELKEQTENTVAKLKLKEQENQKKIQALTDRMNDMLESKLGQKFADVRNDVHRKIINKVEGEFMVAQSSWRLPFFFLLLVLAGAFAFAYQKYQKLVKSHLF